MMTRPIRYALLFSAWFLLMGLVFAMRAHGDTGAPGPASPGSMLDTLLAALKAGSPGLVALVALELGERVLLALASAWTKLKPAVPYVTIASAVTAAALASVAVTGTVTLQAAAFALLIAGVGYYQVPSVRSTGIATSPGVVSPGGNGKQAGSAARDLVLLLGGIALSGMLAGIAGIAACGAPQKAALEQGTIDCAKQDTVSALPQVVAALEGGTANWESDLEKLGVTLGENALACEVKVVVSVLESTQTSSTPATSALSSAESRALINGHAFLANHAYKFASAQ